MDRSFRIILFYISTLKEFNKITFRNSVMLLSTKLDQELFLIINHGKHLFYNVTLILSVYYLATCARSDTDSVGFFTVVTWVIKQIGKSTFVA